MWIDAVGPIHAAAVSPISLFFFTAINRAWQEKCQLHCHQVSLVRVPNHYYILHDSWFLLQITNLIEGLHVTAQLECMQSADNQRRIFTTIAQSYIINIMSVNSWWNPVFKQICGEKTFQELRMLSLAWLALGLRMGAIAEFLHDPHPPRIHVSFRCWYICHRDICFWIFCDISALFSVHLRLHFFKMR